jgi:hypothetical protein
METGEKAILDFLVKREARFGRRTIRLVDALAKSVLTRKLSLPIRPVPSCFPIRCGTSKVKLS